MSDDKPITSPVKCQCGIDCYNFSGDILCPKCDATEIKTRALDFTYAPKYLSKKRKSAYGS